jgi:hypothetical protein
VVSGAGAAGAAAGASWGDASAGTGASVGAPTAAAASSCASCVSSVGCPPVGCVVPDVASAESTRPRIASSEWALTNRANPTRSR